MNKFRFQSLWNASSHRHFGCLIFIIIVYSNMGGYAQENTSEEKVKYDTLIIRENCDFGNGENSTFFPQNKVSSTKCLCYDIYSRVPIFIEENGKTIKYLKIENPSRAIFKLDFTKLPQLNTLEIFGNDFDVIKTLPPDLMQSTSLKNIIVQGVGIPSKEVTRLKKTYPKVSFSNDIPEYDKSWAIGEKSTSNSDIDMTLIINKENKYALWEFPYQKKPTNFYHTINNNNAYSYVCINDSGVDFIQMKSHRNIHSDFYDPYFSNIKDEISSIYFINNGGKRLVKYHSKYITLEMYIRNDGEVLDDTTILVVDSMIYYYGGKSGLLDESFNEIVPFKYDALWIPVSDIVTDKVYNPENNIENPYHPIWVDFGDIYNPKNSFSIESKELILVQEKGLFGAYNIGGKLEIPVIYASLLPIKDDSLAFFAVKPNLKYDVYNHQHKIVKSGLVPQSIHFNYKKNEIDSDFKSIAYNQNISTIAPLVKKLAKKGLILSYDSAICITQVNTFPFDVTNMTVSFFVSKNNSSLQIPFSITLTDTTNNISVSYLIDELKMMCVLYPNDELLNALIEMEEWCKHIQK